MFRISILFSAVLFIQSAQAQVLMTTSPSLVRIRVQKDLEKFPDILNSQYKLMNENMWLLKGQNLIFKNKKISDQNIVIQKMNLKFDLISIIDFEKYLAGVVASEMSESWPLEALKAQAIVAKSYALVKMQERKNNYFQLEDNEKDQVYKKTNSDKVFKAVRQTKNIILKSKTGQIIKAFYHADCGGQTLQATDVWPGEINTGTAVDPWCKQRITNNWSYSVSTSDFYEKLKTNSDDSVEFESVLGSKIKALRLGEQIFSVQKLRQIFGFSNIRNSPDSIQLEANEIHFSGQGYGHGVGLCQRGSFEMALRGYRFSQIIRHYYPEAVLAKE